METETKENVYPLEWLDVLINVTLNPAKSIMAGITSKEAADMVSHLEEDLEHERFSTLIKSQAFTLHNEQEIGIMIKKYHKALIVQLDEALEYQRASLLKHPHLKPVYKALINYLNSALSFLETRFFRFISLDERVPMVYLTATQKELRKKLDELNKHANLQKGDEAFYDIVLKSLYYFTDKLPLRYDVSFRDILYKKELIKGLDNLQHDHPKTDVYSALDELLIYLNYNSKSYMNRLTSKLAQKINKCEEVIEKMDKLLYCYKAFNQLHRKPGVALNLKYHHLENVISNWFAQEVFYLEKKMHLTVVPQGGMSEPAKPTATTSPKEKQKITCALSTDQTALILRAADELRLLIAKSMSEVFKTIVPHLSTPNKAELSYDGMRSKSYAPEERDKQKAIEALERMIKKIKDY